MTLVLPYCSDQAENRLFFEPIRSNMPCVYEGEPLDFESALMSGEWPALKDITAEYEQSEDSSKATSGTGDRTPPKRKHASESNGEADVSEAKKTCTDTYLTSPFAEVDSETTTPVSSPSMVYLSQQDTVEEDDEQFQPRRRGPQMWNSRQRWKDERKKVLKMSAAKISDIEDPELWLLRSVLINNTIKRLHQEIRNERQAKIRHRQQKIDFYHDRYVPPSSSEFSAPSMSTFESKKPQPETSAPSDIYDDTSCDEIFGISEDFLRVTIPDRRMSSSPIPPNLGSGPREDKDSSMDVDPPSSPSPSRCDSSRCDQAHSSPVAFAPRTLTNSPLPQRYPTTTNGGAQCAAQYRTNEGASVCYGGDSTFPPRVPILDSVVYHSLLASLESS